MKILALFFAFVVQFSETSAVSQIFQYENKNYHQDKKLQQKEEDDIREVVFRYQFSHNASGLQQRAEVYFLSLGEDKSPSDEFMKRFADHKPKVKKVSESKKDKNNLVRDKKTDEIGLIFYVTIIKSISDDKVEVSGGYYEAGLSASGNTYTVIRKDGKWVVEKDEMHWIS